MSLISTRSQRLALLTARQLRNRAHRDNDKYDYLGVIWDGWSRHQRVSYIMTEVRQRVAEEQGLFEAVSCR